MGSAGAGDLRAAGAVGQEADSGRHPVRGLAARAGDVLSTTQDWRGLDWQREDGKRFRCDESKTCLGASRSRHLETTGYTAVPLICSGYVPRHPTGPGNTMIFLHIHVSDEVYFMNEAQ